MPFRDAYDAELQINTLLNRGQWDNALSALDAWLIAEPWRKELLLRKAQLLRTLRRYEQGLVVVREFRAQSPTAPDAIFLEIEFLLDLRQTTEAMRLLQNMPAAQRATPQAIYYRGRVLLAQRNVHEGLRQLWEAYQREPGFNRALLEWADIAMRQYGKRWVRSQLERLLARQHDNRTIAVSVGLALNMVDSRYGRSLLRRAVERYPLHSPILGSEGQHNMPELNAPVVPTGKDAYRMINEQLLTGHLDEGLQAYYSAVNIDPDLMSILAPLVAEVLVDELARPEEARHLLEEAMKHDTTNYRLHVSYTKVFLHLGFADEAISSARCALELSPDSEKAVTLVLRAGAHLLLGQRELAVQDVRSALARVPEAGNLVHYEPSLRLLEHDRRFRALLTGHDEHDPWWERLKRWMLGE